MTHVVLAHGWGYDASIWNSVRELLPSAWCVEVIDFGYFGAPCQSFKQLKPGDSMIAVGHSLGALWWLTQAPDTWKKLLCINGFPRFCADEDYLAAVPRRVLARMRTQFAQNPQGVLTDFHARCGAQGPNAAPNAERLATGLEALERWDGRKLLTARRNDIHALAGNGDLIVPLAMSETAFAVLPEGHCRYVAGEGHALPVTTPALCAQWIRNLAV